MAKRRKKTKGRRAYLKRFGQNGVVNTGKGPDAATMAIWHQLHHHLTPSEQRLATRFSTEIQEDVDNLSLNFNHIMRFAINQFAKRKVSEDIPNFANLYNDFQVHQIVLQDSKNFRLLLCWAGHEYKFLKFKGIENTVYVSKPYDSREYAYDRYQRNAIFWLERIPIEYRAEVPSFPQDNG